MITVLQNHPVAFPSTRSLSLVNVRNPVNVQNPNVQFSGGLGKALESLCGSSYPDYREILAEYSMGEDVVLPPALKQALKDAFEQIPPDTKLSGMASLVRKRFDSEA